MKTWQWGTLLAVLGLLLFAARAPFSRMKAVGIRFFGFSEESAGRMAMSIAWIGAVILLLAGLALIAVDLLA